MQTNIRTMHMEDGTTEIQWGRGDSDSVISGYILVHPDGSATFPHGEGFVFHMAGDDTRIVEGEDNYGGIEPDEKVLWHCKNTDSHQRLLNAAARALERCQVADDPSGAADEAADILSKVVELDGTEVLPGEAPERQRYT